jgi:hypothetical protein
MNQETMDLLRQCINDNAAQVPSKVAKRNYSDFIPSL